MPFTQANTLLQVTTPFGADKMLLTRFLAEERISALFRFDLELVSEESALDFKTVLGEGVTVKLKLAGGKARYFHGIVTRFGQAGSAGKLTSYRAEIHPTMWLLGKTRDSRVFQQKTVPEIVKGILGDHAVTPIEDKITGTHVAREYCVQYQESDLDFVSRLLEDEGIFYYFKHDDGKHTLVLSDDASGHAPCPELAKAKYRGDVAASLADEDVVVSCQIEQQVIVGSYSLSDYNFEMPSTSLLAKSDGKDPKLKMYEYPGNHAAKSDGEDRAKLRLEAEEILASRIVGTSYCRAMSAGHTFTLDEHERADANTDYVLLSVTHAITGEEYTNAYEAFPKATPFRPARATPRPLIVGAQTALVTGKSGEEIFTDKYGRIKVQFYWDRLGKKDEQSSCFVRVSQGWAGKSWGAWFLPRIGQEVLVTFLEGDPDRPLISGAVYNAEQTVPYALPDNQTKSTIFSRSSKEGTKGNEVRFEDKKDSEEFYMYATKDMKSVVENDWTIKVIHDQITTIKNDRKVTIEEGNETFTVTKGNRTVEVTKGNEAHSVKGTRDLKVDGEETHATKGAFTHTSKDAYTLKITGDLLIDVTGAITIKSAKSIAMKSGMDTKLESGTDFAVKAGTNLKADGGVNVDIKAGVGLTAKGGAMGTVDGGGMLTVKGGLVKIN